MIMYTKCEKHNYENVQMEKHQKLYDESNWAEIQRIRDAWVPKSGKELRDREYYDWSQTIEENFSRKEIMPNTDEVDIDWEEVMSLQKKMNNARTQMEEKMYKSDIEDHRAKIAPVAKQILTVLQYGIWTEHMLGLGVNDIARKFGVSHQNISQQLESIIKKLTKNVRNLK
jgi:hypothetical protein